MSVDGAASTRAGVAVVVISRARVHPRNAAPSAIVVAALRKSVPFIGGLHLENQRTLLHDAPGCHRDASYDAGCRGLEFVFHFHGFHDNETLTRAHALTLADTHPHHKSGHRRDEARRSAGMLHRARQVANRARAFIERLDGKTVTIDADLVPAAPTFRRPARVDGMYRVIEPEDVQISLSQLVDARIELLAVDADALAVQLDLEVALADGDVVLHRQAAGTSSQTVSTCAVWGNMSNPRSDSTR